MAHTAHEDFPTQRAMHLPLLRALDELGGQASPKAVADRLAAHFGLSDELRGRTVDAGAAGTVNEWDRRVRWVRQRAVFEGLVASPARNVWELAPAGKNALTAARPGVVVTVYTTDLGVALWSTCEDAMGYVDDAGLNLILTSPPYPLLRKKAYGNLSGDAYLEWMTGLAKEWHRLLADDGSLVLNIADVWNPGTPTQSLYQEELLLALVRDVGFHLAQRTYWENPSKMPSPAEWVTIRRVRVTPSVEQVYWLSKTAHPKADNRRVLRPYSASMRKRLADGGDVGGTRPSGHARADGAFGRDLGGSIAHNLLTIPNSSSNDAYQRACKAAGLPVHPARWPKELPGFYIAMLTDPGDLVYDPFGGSGQLAAACERLGRRWLSSELMREYVLGSRFRVQDAPGYRPHAPAAHAA